MKAVLSSVSAVVLFGACGGGASGGSQTCAPLTNLCGRVTAGEVETALSLGAATVTATPNDSEAPGGPINRCDYVWAQGSLTLNHWCYSRGSDYAHQTFTEQRTLGGNAETVTGLGDEAYWSATSTSTIPFVNGAMYSRASNLVLAVGSYSQQGVDAGTAKQRAESVLTKLLKVAGH